MKTKLHLWGGKILTLTMLASGFLLPSDIAQAADPITPGAPIISNVTDTSLDITIDENDNDVSVEYAIQSSNEVLNKEWSTTSNLSWMSSNGVFVSDYSGSAKAIPDGSGGTIIVSNEISNYDIYAQRIDANGTLLWNDTFSSYGRSTGNIVCAADGMQRLPETISDGSGGAIIIWQDDRSGNQWDVYAQHIDANGDTQWTDNGVPITTGGNMAQSHSIISDGSGGAIISWRDRRSGNNGIYTQRIDSSGATQWTSNGMEVSSTIIGSPKIISDNNGGMIIAWNDTRFSSTNPYSSTYGGDIYAQRIDADGNIHAGWDSDGVVICDAALGQIPMDIISDDSDGFIVVWRDMRAAANTWDSDNLDIYAQKIDSSGAVQWTANGVVVCDAEKAQGSSGWNVKLASDGAGGAIVAWMDERNYLDDNAPWWDLYAQRLDSDGNRLWDAGGGDYNGIEISTRSSSQQMSPQIISDEDGGVIIAWQDLFWLGGSKVSIQKVSSDGRRLLGTGDGNYDGIMIETNGAGGEIVSDGNGGAIGIWGGTSYSGLYAQRLGFLDGFIQADGSLDSTKAWQTAAAWGTQTISGLDDNAEHTFKVQARNEIAESDWSTTTSVTTLATPPPNTPGAPIVDNITRDSLDVTIDENGNDSTVKYTIQIDDQWLNSDGELSSSELWQTAASWGTLTVTDLEEGSEHTFIVKAIDTNHKESEASPITTVTTVVPLLAPNTPGVPVIGHVTDTSFYFTFDENENNEEVEYAIQVDDQWLNSEGGLEPSATWQTAAIWDTATAVGLSSETEYSVKIKARDQEEDESDWSPTTTATTLAAPIVPNTPALTIDNVTGTTLDLIIDTNGNDASTEYAIQRSYASGSPQWTENGQAISTATGTQSGSQAVSDGSGGTIITWVDYRSGEESNIYAQKIDSTGIAQWETDIPICTANGNQIKAQIVTDESGGAIITWEDYRAGEFADIYAQRIDSTGTVRWTINGVAIRILIDWWTASPQIIPDGSGGAIITWYDGNADVFAQKINALGETQWTANGAIVSAARSGQRAPVITSDGAGGAILAWYDERLGVDRDIFAQRIDTDGNRVWDAGGGDYDGIAICTANKIQQNPRIISDSTGGAIIIWDDRRSDSYWGIYAQKVDSTGAIQWQSNGKPVSANNNWQQGGQIISDGSDGAIITWADNRSGYMEIFVQRIDSLGDPQWTSGGVQVTLAANGRNYPKILSDNNGGAILTWLGSIPGYYYGIYTQKINSSGEPQWPNENVGSTTARFGVAIGINEYSQSAPKIVSDDSDGAIIIWNDSRLGDHNIYAQRIGSTDEYVQTNSTLGSTETWQTAATWNSPATVADLSPNIEYTFRVKARSTDGTESTWSDAATATTLTGLNTPGAAILSNPTTTTLDLDIDENGNGTEVEYAIRYGTADRWVDSNGNVGLTEVWQTAAEWDNLTVYGLSSGMSSSFYIKARNSTTESDFSPHSYAATNINIPGPIVAEAISETEITFSFDENTTNGNSDDTKYAVTFDGGSNWSGTDGNMYDFEIFSASGTWNTVTPIVDELTPGTDYTIQIKARPTDGNSGAKDTDLNAGVTVTTLSPTADVNSIFGKSLTGTVGKAYHDHDNDPATEPLPNFEMTDVENIFYFTFIIDDPAADPIPGLGLTPGNISEAEMEVVDLDGDGELTLMDAELMFLSSFGYGLCVSENPDGTIYNNGNC